MNSNEKQKEYWTNSAGNLWVKDKSEKDNMLEPLGNYALSKFNIIAVSYTHLTLPTSYAV